MPAHAHSVAHPGGGAGQRRSVSELLRRHGPAFLATHVVTPPQARALRDLMACRTAALGGHVDACEQCGFRRCYYNSCRNRHCPGCQHHAQEEWIASRINRLVETHHFHTVFTVPSELRGLFLANPSALYELLFQAVSQTLLDLSGSKLGALPGVTAILHTWTRDMSFHPHIHCIVTGGGLSLDGTRWCPTTGTFLLPLDAMCAVFRGKFMQGLVALHAAGKLHFAGTSTHLADPAAFRRLRQALYEQRWNVFAKPAFGGAEQVIRYLGRYTHRVAISSSRVLSATATEVVIRTRGSRTVRMTPAEFVRRFLLHILPDGFRKIRHYGLFAPSNVGSRLAAAQALLPARVPRPVADPPVRSLDDGAHRCPNCPAGRLVRTLVARAQARGPP